MVLQPKIYLLATVRETPNHAGFSRLSGGNAILDGCEFVEHRVQKPSS